MKNSSPMNKENTVFSLNTVCGVGKGWDCDNRETQEQPYNCRLVTWVGERDGSQTERKKNLRLNCETRQIISEWLDCFSLSERLVHGIQAEWQSCAESMDPVQLDAVPKHLGFDLNQDGFLL